MRRQAYDRNLENLRRVRRERTQTIYWSLMLFAVFLFDGIAWGVGRLRDGIKSLKLSSHLLWPSYFIDEEVGI